MHYAVKLTTKQKDDCIYRLPTEAEWEYSCRGGRPFSMPFGIGDGPSLSSLEANFDGNYPYGDAVKGVYLEKTCPVGSYLANALRLHDMHGNVWEWCSDWYADYPKRTVINPSGPSGGSERVFRGGGWLINGTSCRAAVRCSRAPTYRDGILGFRLARSTPAAGK